MGLDRHEAEAEADQESVASDRSESPEADRLIEQS